MLARYLAHSLAINSTPLALSRLNGRAYVVGVFLALSTAGTALANDGPDRLPAAAAQSEDSGEVQGGGEVRGEGEVRGDSTIAGKTGSTEIVIQTTHRLAGAIDSLTWNGKEFINSYDHGRQLQSALSFDGGSDAPFWAERFNPTEAGSRRDHTGDRSTSQLLELHAQGNELFTKVRMAFWLAPGEESFGRLALNPTTLSNHHHSKRVRIGWRDHSNVIRYDAAFHIAENEPHRYAQFEALTGYMPPEFSKFWYWVADTDQLKELDDGPGEQPFPVILSTPDLQFAMAVCCPPRAAAVPPNAGDLSGPSYGRFRFHNEQVVKWNCVFRVRNQPRIIAGDYRFSMFVIVGTVRQVQTALAAIYQAHS